MSDKVGLNAAVEEIAEQYCNKPVPRSQSAILIWRKKFAEDKANIKSIILAHLPKIEEGS